AILKSARAPPDTTICVTAPVLVAAGSALAPVAGAAPGAGMSCADAFVASVTHAAAPAVDRTNNAGRTREAKRVTCIDWGLRGGRPGSRAAPSGNGIARRAPSAARAG